MQKHGFRYVKTPDPVYLATNEDALEWVSYFSRCGAVGYDTETTGLHKLNSRIKFFSMADEGHRICGPIRLLHHFAGILEDVDIEKRLTNAKYDMHLTDNHGIILRGRVCDTIPADWLLDENRQGDHGLKETALDFLGLRMRSFKEVFGSANSKDQEVQMLGFFHDCLELMDVHHDKKASREWAADLFVELKRADCDTPEVLEHLQKLSVSRRNGYLLDATKLLKMARHWDLTTKTTGKMGYVSDWVVLLGGDPVPVKEREDWGCLMGELPCIEDAHEKLLRYLRPLVKVDTDSLELARLMVADYSSLDAWASYMLLDVYRDDMANRVMFEETGETLLDQYEDIEVPFTRVLWNCERRGFAIDQVLAESYSAPLHKELGILDRRMVSLVGHDFNPNSTPQMLDVFFTRGPNDEWLDPFGMEPTKMTKGSVDGVKTPSLSKEVVQEWADMGNELAQTLLDHRSMAKLTGTYVDKLPEMIDTRGRLHTSLNQIGAVSGRLSSSDPGLQNIPSKGMWGKKIRKMFVAGRWGDCRPEWCMEAVAHIPVPDYPDDYEMTLIVADYDQLEMRIMAHVSEDPVMLAAIWDGLDLHCRTAELADGLDYDELLAAKKADPKTATPRQLELVDVRGSYKSVGFGLLYGIGAVKLGLQLKYPIIISKDKYGRVRQKCPQSGALIKKYFGIFEGVEQYILDIHAQVLETQVVQTIAGRFRRLPTILSEDKGIAAQARRQSVNSIVQGGAADIVKMAMLKCERDPELRMMGVRMLLQIHDELVFEVPKDADVVAAAQARIKVLMENPYPMRVPITISMHSDDSWGGAKA